MDDSIKLVVIIAGLVLLLCIVCVYWAVISDIFARPARRRKYYEQAVNHAKTTGKRLLVVGDPEAGNLLTRVLNTTLGNYGYGDICIDLYSEDPRVKRIGLAEYLAGCKANSHVIFISCVLEFVDDLENVIQELDRVSGGSANQFIVFVKYHNVSSYYDGKHNRILKKQNIILEAPPEHPKIKFLDQTGNTQF